jgi:hypothetical protein
MQDDCAAKCGKKQAIFTVSSNLESHIFAFFPFLIFNLNCFAAILKQGKIKWRKAEETLLIRLEVKRIKPNAQVSLF